MFRLGAENFCALYKKEKNVSRNVKFLTQILYLFSLMFENDFTYVFTYVLCYPHAKYHMFFVTHIPFLFRFSLISHSYVHEINNDQDNEMSIRRVI